MTGPSSLDEADAEAGDEVDDLLATIKRAKGRLRELLVERETQLRMATRLAAVGAWRLTLQPLRFLPSGEWLRVMGHAGHAVPSASAVLRRFAPAQRFELLARLREALRDDAALDLIVPARNFAGARVWLRLMGEPEYDGRQRLVALHGACQDVTEQVAREREATRLAQSLTNTFESITDGLISLGRDWQVEYVNAAAERILRCQRENLVDRVLWQAWPQGLGSAFHTECELALAENRSRVFQWYWEPAALWLEVRAYPSEHGLAVYFTDVTQQHALQQELDRYRRGLEQLVAERTQELRNINDELTGFAVAVAHDLRAPLAAIDGFSRALHDRMPADDEKARHYAGRVEAGVARMEAMISALLALARVGQAPMERVGVDVAALAADVVEGLRAADPLRSVQVDIVPDLQAHADPQLLRTVLDNLLGNAWKFTGRQAAPRIGVGRTPEGAFYVADNGAGFDLAHAHNLFAPFQRFHSQGEFPGHGVGLAAVRRVIQRHGGRLWVTTAPEEGATFWFTLVPSP